MKKSSLFISAALTVFVLAIVAGAITASRFSVSAGSTSTVQLVTPVSVVVPSAITAEQAAQVAAAALGRNDLYSVETSSINGLTAYKVIFSSGNVAYVDTTGQFLGVVASASAAQQQPASSFFGEEHDGDND